MPINTGQGTLNTGKDVSMDVVLTNGHVLRIGNITKFDRKPTVKKLQSNGIDGNNRRGVIPEGWVLTIEADREDAQVETWWADYEAGYYNGLTVQNVTILETIIEGDGTVTQWRYTGVAFHFDDAGNVTADKFIGMKLSGEASRRIRIQ
ncbi:MAG: hypothetical protein ABL901_02975 [Hyphomicrobiaceae bacterium]|nr:hypothetical protein [Hyphomicrobiaceae bacterium]